MPGTAGRTSTGTTVVQPVGVLVAWAALVGFGTFGAFTELPSWADVPDAGRPVLAVKP